MVGKSTIEEKYYTSTFDDPVLLNFFLNLPQDADGLESPLQEHVAEMQGAAPDQYHVRQRQGHVTISSTT